MRHRVEAEPAHEPCGVVAQSRRGVGMHEFVNGDPENDRDDECDEPDRIVRGPLHRGDEPAAKERIEEEDKADDEKRVRRSGARPAQTSCDHSLTSLGCVLGFLRESARTLRRVERWGQPMGQAVWTGSISFGLVSIPVKLYPATEPKDVRFHLYDRRTGKRLHYERVTRQVDAPAFEPDPFSAASPAEDPPEPTIAEDLGPPRPAAISGAGTGRGEAA